MLHCLEEGIGILEGCVFPIDSWWAELCFCTLGNTHYIFSVVENASALELDTTGFKCHSLALSLGASYLSSLNHDLLCKMGVKILHEGIRD